MKKILLIAAATAALTTSVMADEGQFYVRLDGSANKFQGFTSRGTGLKTKTSWDGGVEAGVGYYMMDNVRGELVYVKPFNVEAKKTGVPSFGGKLAITNKADINAVLVKAYVDVADLGMAKLFVGGGLGWSRLKEKISGTYDGGQFESISTKVANTLAWTAGLGAGCDVADGVKIDVQYAYTDFGKTKAVTPKNSNTSFGKNPYKAHSGKVGVRFDI